VVRVEDLFGFDRYGASWVKPSTGTPLGDDPNEILAGLGTTHVLLVDRLPGDGRPSKLVDPTPPERGSKLPPVEVRGEPLFTLRPGSAGDARLPTAISFPLTQLWRLERPGPEIAVYVFGRD
jgi:hypothetical protein